MREAGAIMERSNLRHNATPEKFINWLGRLTLSRTGDGTGQQEQRDYGGLHIASLLV
jgi:hypothetical protein